MRIIITVIEITATVATLETQQPIIAAQSTARKTAALFRKKYLLASDSLIQLPVHQLLLTAQQKQQQSKKKRKDQESSFTKMQYEFLPHTADVKFIAYGKTLEEAFSNAALALTKVIVNPSEVKPKVEKTIEIESEDEKALLYDFLEQFLILLDIEDFLLNSVKEIKIDKKEKLKLKAVITGDTEIEKYEPDTHIKAVTYQEMEIKKEPGKVMLQVVLDL